ncbi:MAG: hypothetical protein KBE22_12640 [Candidatus Accumulibacter sp.]|nr:hypothetical protein [Accumulibacter sp.]
MTHQFFTIAAHQGYASCAAEKEAAGIGTLNEAATSRTAFALRLFVRFGAPSYGRPNGRSRKARRCLIGSSNSRSVALPYWNRGRRFNSATEANTMQNPTAHPAAIVAARDSLANAQDNLEPLSDFPRHISTLCEVIDLLSSDALLVSSLAGIGKALADHLAILSVPVIEAVDAALMALRNPNKENDHE